MIISRPGSICLFIHLRLHSKLTFYAQNNYVYKDVRIEGGRLNFSRKVDKVIRVKETVILCICISIYIYVQ